VTADGKAASTNPTSAAANNPKAATNGKGKNGTGNTSGNQSSSKSQSQQSTQQQVKGNGNKDDATKGQQAASSTPSGTGGKRRLFRLEVRKDGH
jgi:hypothetical protein